MKVCPHCGTPNPADAEFCVHCGATTGAPRPDPLIGRTVGGAYLLQELVGVGGMGRVYRAEQNMLGRTVAVKVIHPHLLGDDQTVARFYNEARAASRLNHPDSVSIIDFGRTEDGILYLVMEYLAGRDLAHILAEEGPLPFPRISRIVRHVLSALGEAHALGVVHRDLKPENVICRRVRRGAEQVKVVDFGLAHIVGPGGTSITTPGLVSGTPDYMSPEQGRGETVDGRGDLYSVGVVLFEMLTDRLPFEDDTPTKVVFKHIHEQVKDPREVAPHRHIPDSLAQICLKALSKRASDRYQTADEMYEVLVRVSDRLESVKTGAIQICPQCDTRNPSDQRFCGSCGARLGSELSLPPSTRTDPPPMNTSLLPGPTISPLVGRGPELERLVELRDQSAASAVWVTLQGEPGVGKSRLMTEFAARLASEGDAVALAGPHPSGAPVPYWPIRTLLTTLLDADEERLRQIAQSEAIGDPLARAGIAEALEPMGLAGRPGESRVAAVAVALSAAVRVAAGRSRSGLVTVFVDDLWRCDDLSAQALLRTTKLHPEGGLFLVTSSRPRDPDLDDEIVKMLVRGLELDHAGLMLSGKGEREAEEVDRSLETMPSARLLLPLYLEQLRALGVSGMDMDETLPPRLADAVLARVERLNIASRRVLQVACVLGDRAPLTQLTELARGEDLDAIKRLQADGLLVMQGENVAVCHSFVRELVETSIPAEHRKELHAQALQVVASGGAPLEVRAEHAWRAGEPMSALMLLEQMGDSANRRGDSGAAVLAFRRGLELARREVLMTGETSLDRAIVTFSRKLGDAMDRHGETTAADGVLREALELAGPANSERPKMLLALSRVAQQRNRQRDATRFLGQALELSDQQGDRMGEALAHLALGRLRLADGDARTALGTVENAIEAASNEPNNAAFLVEAHVALAEAQRAVGNVDAARASLDRAKQVAEGMGAKAVLARVFAALAATFDGATREASARSTELFREAGRLASEAGDAEGAVRWNHLGRDGDAQRSG